MFYICFASNEEEMPNCIEGNSQREHNDQNDTMKLFNATDAIAQSLEGNFRNLHDTKKCLKEDFSIFQSDESTMPNFSHNGKRFPDCTIIKKTKINPETFTKNSKQDFFTKTKISPKRYFIKKTQKNLGATQIPKPKQWTAMRKQNLDQFSANRIKEKNSQQLHVVISSRDIQFDDTGNDLDTHFNDSKIYVLNPEREKSKPKNSIGKESNKKIFLKSNNKKKRRSHNRKGASTNLSSLLEKKHPSLQSTGIDWPESDSNKQLQNTLLSKRDNIFRGETSKTLSQETSPRKQTTPSDLSAIINKQNQEMGDEMFGRNNKLKDFKTKYFQPTNITSKEQAKIKDFSLKKNQLEEDNTNATSPKTEDEIFLFNTDYNNTSLTIPEVNLVNSENATSDLNKSTMSKESTRTETTTPKESTRTETTTPKESTRTETTTPKESTRTETTTPKESQKKNKLNVIIAIIGLVLLFCIFGILVTFLIKTRFGASSKENSFQISKQNQVAKLTQ
jgi:cobalamin biosynthesis Mg chelatase CobN